MTVPPIDPKPRNRAGEPELEVSPWRRLRRPLALALFALLLVQRAEADAGWFETGDSALRLDLQLLNDADVIRLPVTEWPLPRAAVKYALANAKERFAINGAVEAALARVRARLDRDDGIRLESEMVAGDAGLLRDFGSLGRENVEMGGRAGIDGDHFAVGVRVTGVSDPDDGQKVRLDGTHATVQLGNWLVGANALERWWGPNHEGSLILSNNARPMPTLMIARAEARPFESRWLDWLGPWRMSFAVSRMEGKRADIDAPLFMAWRVTTMPFKDIEFGLSRTAQFCGKGLECNLRVFGNLLVGNDNVGFNTTRQNEPGNQMAGFDMRWKSPIGNLPYAIYAQAIGEDQSSLMPVKLLRQAGFDVWHPLRDGGVLQLYGEYSDTTCQTVPRKRYNCAYNQGRFNVEGYRYRGRVIGFTADRDSHDATVGALLNSVDDTSWSATVRWSNLNLDDFGDVRNTVASVPTKYAAVELGWQGKMFAEAVSIQVGIESVDPANANRKTDPYGFLSWHHEFKQ